MSAFGFPKQYQFFVVQTGSMEPAIPTGSVILVQPQESYQVGDVVTVKISPEANPRNPNLTVTHRITEITEENGERLYTTKGDANAAADLDLRPQDSVIGRSLVHVPYLGYPVGFAKTQIGFIVLIVIPATLIVYSEILSIKKEIKRKIKERKKDSEESIEMKDVSLEEKT